MDWLHDSRRRTVNSWRGVFFLLAMGAFGIVDSNWIVGPTQKSPAWFMLGLVAIEIALAVFAAHLLMKVLLRPPSEIVGGEYVVRPISDRLAILRIVCSVWILVGFFALMLIILFDKPIEWRRCAGVIAFIGLPSTVLYYRWNGWPPNSKQ
jgi:hypothetical protein